MLLLRVLLLLLLSHRTTKNVVTLSNVTLWVPAAEFSFIRSHTAATPTSFTINLQGTASQGCCCCCCCQVVA
jgi:hypothetical protein